MRDTFDKFHERDDRGRFGENESAARRSSSRVTGASDLHDLLLAFHAQTEKALLVSKDGDEARAVWLPKSLIEFESPGKPYISGKTKAGRKREMATIKVTLPDWAAVDKGLL